jgi:hypothetical protein
MCLAQTRWTDTKKQLFSNLWQSLASQHITDTKWSHVCACATHRTALTPNGGQKGKKTGSGQAHEKQERKVLKADFLHCEMLAQRGWRAAQPQCPWSQTKKKSQRALAEGATLTETAEVCPRRPCNRRVHVCRERTSPSGENGSFTNPSRPFLGLRREINQYHLPRFPKSPPANATPHST